MVHVSTMVMDGPCQYYGDGPCQYYGDGPCQYYGDGPLLTQAEWLADVACPALLIVHR